MKCSICEKSFAAAISLQGHMRIHGPSKGILCRPKCSCILTRRVIEVHLLFKFQKSLRKCITCGNFLTSKYQKKFCSNSCAAKFNNQLRIKPVEFMKNKTQYKEQTKFMFNLSDFPIEFDFELLQKYGMYNPISNKFGVSRDHMFSVSNGFKQQVDPYFIGHPANCELILQSDNSRKNHNSSITLDELFDRVRIWEEKYQVVSTNRTDSNL